MTPYIAKKEYQGLLYILPWLAGFLLLQLYPFIASFYYALTDYNMGKNTSFVGLQNYITMLTKDREFWNSMRVTLLYVCISVPMKLCFALFIAMLLNLKLKGINIFRTVYYIPSILGSSVAVAVVWRMIFLQEGSINVMLGYARIPPVNWLGNPLLALVTICLLAVWQFGSSMVVFLAGLKQIPAELYEAAKVDGVSPVKSFLYITIPMLTPMVFFNIVMQMINAFQEFTSAFIITNGGPLQGTYLYGMKLYNEAFRYFKIGYASALSWVLFIVIMIFTALLFKSSQNWVYYEDGDKK